MAIEPPSQSLIHSLRSLNLATEAQLRACQKHLRNLVRDLPAFDSVWIDALVQGEVLTPFQAKLWSQSPESLQLGSYVLVDRLPHDGWPVRYRAVPLAGGRPVAISVLPANESELPAVGDRFQRHVTSVQGLVHRHLCLATSLEVGVQALHAISTLPSGEPLDELFVRRGRFPAEVVEEIARQALDGLSRLEQAGTLHGDVRLRNLLLEQNGRLQIINAGLLAAVHPHLTIHSTLPIACHEGIAPELIGGRLERSPATEMYALGCLLWHLLAGRAPYLTADRIEQLAAHQSGTIPDVRTMAPETPSSLAALIARLVARHPSERFRSLTTASTEFGSSQARGRARLSQFQASFQSMVPVRLGRSEKSRRSASLQSMMIAAIVIGAAALFLFPGAGRSVLQSAGRMLHATQETSSPHAATFDLSAITALDKDGQTPQSNTLPAATVTSQALPRPTPQETTKHSGLYILKTVGPFAAGVFSNVGDLRVIAAEGVHPVIEIVDQPLRLSGRRVFLEHVIIRRAQNAVAGIPLLQVDTQSLKLSGCQLFVSRLPTRGASDSSVDPSLVAIRWQHLDENDIQPGMIECSDCLFVGGAAVMHCDSVPQAVRMSDSTCLGAGALCEVMHTPSARTLQMSLTRTTLRQSGPLLREHQLTAQRQTQVHVNLKHSVLDLSPEVAVIEALGAIKSNWRPDVKIDSNGSFLNEGTAYMAIRPEGGGELMPLDPAGLDIEGLMTAHFEFAGPLSPRWNNNVVTRYTADVQSDERPGVTERQRAD